MKGNINLMKKYFQKFFLSFNVLNQIICKLYAKDSESYYRKEQFVSENSNNRLILYTS